MKKFILAAILALSSSVCRADDDDSDIVTGCLLANAEFGIEMAHICIKENQTARAAVLRYPDDVKGVVARCSRHKDRGWEFVRQCIDDDIAAGIVLDTYARDHGPLMEGCRDEFRRNGAVSTKLCVEKAIEAEKSRGDK